MELKTKTVKGMQLKHMITKCLYFDKAMSCAELSELFDKSIPSIAKALNELIEKGFVVEEGYAPSSGGRRPLMYAINADAMYILAIAMDQKNTRIQLVDLRNQPVADMMMFELKLAGNEQALDTLVRQIYKYLDESGVLKDKITGIGIGMPGFIDPAKGINYTYLKTTERSLAQYITDETGLPTYIDNDSSLIALAEQKFGIAKLQKEVMVINLSWGIGLGMIVNGELFRGRNGVAGECSHIPLLEDGALCECGKRGCLEAEASMLVVANKAIEGITQGRITSLKVVGEAQSKQMSEAIMPAATYGDQFAIELFSDSGYKIGKALAILIHIMNPEAIVLSGRGAKVGKILMAPIQQALHKYCIPRLSGGTELLISELGFDAELIGAAILVKENFVKVVMIQVVSI